MHRGARELLEETGYAGDPPDAARDDLAQSGLLAQRIATIVIRNARQIAEPAPDQTEELTVELVPVSEDPLAHQERRDRTRSLRGRPSLVARPIRRSRRAMITGRADDSARSGSRLAVWSPGDIARPQGEHGKRRSGVSDEMVLVGAQRAGEPPARGTLIRQAARPHRAAGMGPTPGYQPGGERRRKAPSHSHRLQPRDHWRFRRAVSSQRAMEGSSRRPLRCSSRSRAIVALRSVCGHQAFDTHRSPEQHDAMVETRRRVLREINPQPFHAFASRRSLRHIPRSHDPTAERSHDRTVIIVVLKGGQPHLSQSNPPSGF